MMYSVILIAIGILLALCVPDFRGVFFSKILLVVMFLLMAYTTDNADMPAYINLYAQIDSITKIGLTDPGFGLLMYLGRVIGLDYFGFLKVITLIGLFALNKVFKRTSYCPAIVLALYFILDFPTETIQVRAFLAEIILYSLLFEFVNNTVFDIKGFCVLLAFAVLMHSTSLFFVLILLAVLIKKRKKLTITILITMFLVPAAGIILRYVPIPMIQAKLQPYFSSQREHISMAALIYVGFYFVLTFFIWRIVVREIKSVGEEEGLIQSILGVLDIYEWRDKLEKLLRIHIICSLACVLMIVFSSNFYRIIRIVMVVDFIFLGNYYFNYRPITRKKIAFTMLGIMGLFFMNEALSKSLQTLMVNNSFFSRLL